ncbi:MAG: DUF5320 domain-containing protein [Armatimonadota bacterium]
MPAGDGTGPMGMGPMTGRAAGYCAGYEAPGYANPGPRMGMGWGRGWGGGWGGGGGWGRGRGWRRGYYATGMPFWARHGYGYAPPAAYGPPTGYAPYGAAPTKEDEIAALRTQAEWLRDSLEAITSRIEELEQEGA